MPMAESPKRQRKPKRPDPGRIVRKALEAGLAVGRVEIDRDGKIIIFAGKPEQAPDTGAEIVL